MAYRVTKAVTKYGRVYKVGEIITDPTGLEDSLRRTFKWDILDDPEPSLTGMRKPDLIQLAESRGLDAGGLTKPELIELLEG